MALVVVVGTTAAGCAAVAGIFKAGVWVGIIIAVLVVAVLGFVFSRAAR
jgi:hypothetical protein